MSAARDLIDFTISRRSGNNAMIRWELENKKRTVALSRTYPLRTRSRNCRTLHATRQRYSLQAIEDNGGLSTLRGTLSWLDMSPIASGIQAAISRSCQPPLENQPAPATFHPLPTLPTNNASKKRMLVRTACILMHWSEKVRSLLELIWLKVVIFRRCVNLNFFKF